MKEIFFNEISVMNKEIQNLMDQLKKNTVFIFPCNQNSIELKNILEDRLGIGVDFFCDNCEKSEKDLMSFKDFELYKEIHDVTIFLSNKDVDLWFEDFWKFENAGIPCSNIVNYKQINYYLSMVESGDDFLENQIWTLNNVDEVKKSSAYRTLCNLEKCCEVFSFLEDDTSKITYKRMVAKKIVKCKFFFDVYSPGQYFTKEILDCNDEEVYFDVGAFNGDTIESFVREFQGKYKYIYAFEPDNTKFPELLNNTGKYENISFLNVGLYDVTGMVRFKNAIWGSSHIVEKDSDNIISKNCIDKLVMRGDDLNLNPTLIKMDIEGSELKALEGLKHTIRKNNSKLAICAYHRPEDLWEIPLSIKTINKNFEIYIRHHSYTDTETVCYAKVNQLLGGNYD